MTDRTPQDRVADDAGMTIGAAAKASGVPVRTIRFYETMGLIGPTRRTDAGYRSFSQADVDDLAFLRRSRGFGFGLEDCRTLLALYRDKARASKEVRAIARDRLKEIDAQMDRLSAMRQSLAGLVSDAGICLPAGRSAWNHIKWPGPSAGPWRATGQCSEIHSGWRD